MEDLGNAVLEPTKLKKIKILSLSWRDIKSPKAGGAEIFTHNMLAYNAQQYEIVSFSPSFPGGIDGEVIDNITYFRKGGIFSVIWHAFCYYKKNQKDIDYVIDQCNTHRFFTKFWVPKSKRIFLIFQLTREIWAYHMAFPFCKLGKWLETSMLRLNRNDITITESESTKQDLISVGYQSEKICIIPIGLDFEPWKIERWVEKKDTPVFIYVGRYARYKGIDAAIESIALLKKHHPTAQLWIVGKCDQQYTEDVLIPLCQKLGLSMGYDERDDVVLWGFVSAEKKVELQSRSTALLFPSLREGWGMIVTEAAAVGTPSIVYNSPGCRDAVNFGKCGYLCKENTPEELANLMQRTIENRGEYFEIQQSAYNFSCDFNWAKTGLAFAHLIENLQENQNG